MNNNTVNTVFTYIVPWGPIYKISQDLFQYYRKIDRKSVVSFPFVILCDIIVTMC